MIAGMGRTAYRRAMLRRLLAIITIMLALGPGGMREGGTSGSRVSPLPANTVTVEPLSARLIGQRHGQLTITGAWRLRSGGDVFGGMSALVALSPHRLLAASDDGDIMTIDVTDGRTPRVSPIRPLSAGPTTRAGARAGRDVEALTRDGATGRIWAAFELRNQIWRFDASTRRPQGFVQPAAMRNWPANSGSEAMTRLADGRFLILSEAAAGPIGGTDALLFDGDPVSPQTPPPLRFSYLPGDMGRPTEAAALPDGRVLILHRRMSLTEGFVTTLAIADPARINARQLWQSTEIGRFAPPTVTENFEGMAITKNAPTITIWMVSDDNLNSFQRTLFLRLRFDPTAAQRND
jgi:hypothetical protein